MNAPPTLITADWKMSKVLETYPELLDTLVGISPAFTRLRNPLLRKVQSRLVTVEQAAHIAELEPAALVRELNVAAGFNVATVHAATLDRCAGCGSEPAWLDTAQVEAEIDAQWMLDRGLEPFNAISDAARRVSEGGILRVLVGFEPAPLYDALGKLGFDHWAVRLDSDRWQVDFYHERALTPNATVPVPNEESWLPDQFDAELTINVSELVPPEPLVKILTAMAALPAGKTLRVHHVRRPIHLYPQLDDLGYRHFTRELGPRQIELLIHKPARPGEEP
jgi:hypothetical protein